MGLRHLERAALNTSIKLDIEWKPFFLNPHIRDAEDLSAHLLKKYGQDAVSRYLQPDNPLSQAGAKAMPPITFDPDRKIYNTRITHALFEYVKEKAGNEPANVLMVQLFERYFEKAEDITNASVLKEALSASALSPDLYDEMIVDKDSRMEQVERMEQMLKHQYRVRGVPFFVIERKDGERPFGISGAQPVDILEECLLDANVD